MLLKNKKDSQSLNQEILNAYGYTDDLLNRAELVRTHAQTLYDIFKHNSKLTSKLMNLESIFNFINVDFVIDSINTDKTNLQQEYQSIDDDESLPIFYKGYEIIEQINYMFYHIIENKLEKSIVPIVEPLPIEKSLVIEKLLCIAMLDVDIKKLCDLGFYGEDIKKAIDYSTEFLRKNK